MKGEFEFYAGLSGLGTGRSLADHRLAYFRTQSGLAAGLSSVDYEHAWLKGLYPSVGPDLDSLRLHRARTLSGLPAGLSYADYATVMFAGGGGGDVTPPTAGTLAASNITSTTFDLTVSGASDAVGLHAQPYRFSTDNGSSWSAWQASPVFNVTGKTASTAYTCRHETRDAALNTSAGSSIVVTTLAAALWSVDIADPASYPGTGSTVTDTVGGVNLTVTNSPTYTSTDPDYFSLTDLGAQKMETAAETSLQLTGAQSWEAWVRVLNTDEGAILSRGAVTGSGGMMLWLVSGQVRLYVQLSARASVAMPLNVWRQVVGVLDGTNAKIYLNGAEAVSSAYTGFPAAVGSVPFNVGWYNLGFYATMDFSAAAIYNKALSPTEITALFDAKKARFGL